MSWLSTLCGLVVGAVLLVGGVAKLGRDRATRRAMDDLEVPRPLRLTLVARAVPVTELVLAVGVFVLPGPWHRVAGGLAAALLLIFAVLLARVVRAGRNVGCACFGALGSGRVTAYSVARNGVLAAAAAVFAAGPRGFASATSDLTPVHGLGWWIALLALIGALAARVDAERRRRREVDALHLTDAQGRTLAFRELVDPPTYLVFLTAGCSSCAALVPRLRTWPTVYGDVIDIQPVLVGEPGGFRGREAFAPLVEHVLYDRERAVAKALELRAFPSGVLITKEQPLGAAPAAGFGPMRLALDALAGAREREAG